MTKHVHADLIHAWADGAIIEFKTPTSTAWLVASTPGWDEHTLYRIKPANKVRYGMIGTNGYILLNTSINPLLDQIKLTFEGDSTKIIAVELLNQE